METLKLAQKTINICQDSSELAVSVAEQFIAIGKEAIERSGRFMVALSGGSTPKLLYSVLAAPEYSSRIVWSKTHLFWGDERCVSHDSPESNYKMVSESLLSCLSIPGSNVHPISGQDKDPLQAARNYAQTLLETFSADNGVPRFDLILLGLGTDGHTASLFPETEVLSEDKELVAASYVAKLGAYRITLTPRTINAAANIIFMVAGKEKMAIIPQVLQTSAEAYPAQLIQPGNGQIEWYIDQAAAQQPKVRARVHQLQPCR